MDIQLLLVIILGLLAVSLTVVCVYVIVILKEFRVTLTKLNYFIDNAHRATNSLVNPTTTVMGIASTVLEAIKTVKAVRTIADISKDEED